MIREAINNCIAHQDYICGGRINVIEKDDELIFSNMGSFIPGTVDKVIRDDAPEEMYRNPFLATAMFNLKMVDTLGSGIRRMFTYQRKRCFPMPEYDLTGCRVKVTITGKVLDLNYARILAKNPDLTLEEIILLDKVQKKRAITKEEVDRLKEKGLVEGRKPNFHISQKVAEKTDQKAEYIKNRGFKDHHYKEMILEYIEKYGSASKSDISTLLLDILPLVLSDKQKENKVRNLVYDMSKRDQTIINQGTNRKPSWKRRV
ncbi:MAG: ATP-binding protein [Bacteroidales bacterium]